MAEQFHFLRNTILRLFDITWQLVSGLLTTDGIQSTSTVDTTTANVDVVVFNQEINPSITATIIKVEFALTILLRSVSSATADLKWKWQASNDGVTWVDLMAAITETNIGTTAVEKTIAGYFTPETNFNAVPFQIRLLLQCNEANEGRGSVKNSSYVRFLAKV